MPQEHDQEADHELILKFCMDVYMQYPSLSPEEAVKKAWKIASGKMRAQLTRDMNDPDSCSSTNPTPEEINN